MRTSTFILAASAALVAAQDIRPFIPECSQKCLQEAASSSSTCKIEPLDGKCVCAPATFEKVSGAAVSCVLAACGQDVALGQVLPGVQKYCESVLAGGSSGGSSSAPAPVSSSSAAPAPTSTKAPTTSAAPTSAAPTTTSTPIGTVTSAKPTTSAPAGNSTRTSSSSPASSSTGRPSSPAVPAGAASASAGFVGLLAAVGLGIFVL